MTRISIEQAMQTAMEHHRQGRVQQAEALYRQVLAVQPDQADAMQLLGLVQAEYKRFDEAIELIERAISIHPDVPDYAYNLARVFEGAGRDAEAIETYRKATAIKPDFIQGWNNLGATLLRTGHPKEAVDAFARVVSFRPELVDAQVCMGIGLQRQLKFDQAIETYRRAISLRPDDALAHYNLGTSLLTIGDFAAGWENYEWRWELDASRASRPNLAGPMWDGSAPLTTGRSDLQGNRILLWPEQGFGDAIQFARYAPLLAQHGAKVILSAPPELARLMESLEGVEKVTPEREPKIKFDMHAPLLSLPRLFRTTLANIPANIPYLHADSQRTTKWKERIPPNPNRLKIGLAWAGRPTHADDRNRSMPVEALTPLLETSPAWFTSLQKGPAAAPFASFATGAQATDWSQDLHDFADTAALIDSLDLIIAVDTAVAHLAGAMGKPVWLLLPYVPDWRWMLGRSDSPWYPTARLFRQPRPGDWETPIQDIARSLREIVGGKERL